MKKFDLYKELENKGFAARKDEYGFDVLVKEFSKEVEIAWIGKEISVIRVEVRFNKEKTTATASYFSGYSRFKEKTHLNDKKAFNAIKATVEFKGFEF